MASKKRWSIAQFAERKWWQRYLRNKDVNEYLAWKNSYWQGIHDMLVPHVPFSSAKSIADIGCGPAGIFMLYQASHAVTAIDPLLDSYEQSLPHFKRSMYPAVKFVNQSLEEYRAQENFDIVYCLNAINHVQDITLSYAQLCSSLEDGGYLIVSIDAHNYAWLKKIFQAIPGDVLHPHQYEAHEYEAFATKHGMQLLHQQLIKREGIFSYYMQVFKKGGGDKA
ncbi:MAG: hypothetical protein RL660_2435 [Bacteroidota bacterium]|jgi:2-polyprenyl-6-hydroxyphenyl methylase/3-demethylubiquinone-9 3-methyltransferase